LDHSLAPMCRAAVRLSSSIGALALCLAPTPASAEEPDAGLAVIVGAASNLAGMVVGGTEMATSHGKDTVLNAGWLTIETGFTVAPFAAHAVVGEWGRGALFAVVPAAAVGGTATLFGTAPNVVDRGSIDQQRLMWCLFVAGQVVSIAGVIDAALAPWRSKKIFLAPTVGAGRVGVQIGGIF
jgi:hypothetical protein